MATIYQKDGRSLYDQNGATYDASTGQVVSGTPAIPSPFYPTAGSAMTGPSVVSARQANEQVAGAIGTYQNIQRQQQTATAQETATKAAEAKKPTQEQPTPLTLAFQDPSGTIRKQTFYDPEINRANIQSLISGGWEAVDGTIPSGVGPNVTAQQVQNDQEYETLVGELDKLRTGLSAASQRYIDSIKGVYESRKQQMQDINTREQASLQAFGISSGASRYTGSYQGILSEQERQGIRRLTELDVEEKQLIADAEQAYTLKDFELLTKKMDLYNRNQEKKKAQLEALQKTALEANNALEQQRRQSSRDDAIAGLISQGITDPATVLDFLNYDQQGKKVGDFTAKEVAETLKHLTVEQKDPQKLPADIETFEWLRNNNRLPQSVTKLPPEQQYLAYLNMQHLANAGKLSAAGQIVGSSPTSTFVGVGAKDATEEQIIHMRLFAKLMNVLNKGQVSDADAARIDSNINSLRKAGLTEQEIMSRLAGFPTDVETPYNPAFISAIAANTETLEQQQTVMAKVGQLMAQGHFDAAMTVVENQGMANARKIDPDNYLGTGTAESYVRKIKEINTLIQKYWPATIGPVSGTFQNILGKMKSNQAQEVKSKVTALVAQMRNDLSGTAVTESEAKFLEPLIPDLTDRSSNFAQKINALERNVLTQYNSTRGLASLPELTADQIINKNARLSLYGNGGGLTGTPFQSSEDFLNMPTPSAGSYDPNVWSAAR